MSADEEHASKRARPNVGSALRRQPGPDYAKGVKYWEDIEATVDGVLGGFGTGPVPHIEQLASRLFLLSVLPQLHTFATPLTPTPLPGRPTHRLTALDVGAGIGRVSNTVLLPLFDDVVVAEPVEHFLEEAYRAASAGEWREMPRLAGRIRDAAEAKENERRVAEFKEGRGKRGWFVKAGLQQLDPAFPTRGTNEDLGVVGEALGGEAGGLGHEEQEMMFDAIWCQWCLGHMTHDELVSFLKRAKASLRPVPDMADEATCAAGLIIIKENCCEDEPDGGPREFLDEEDSSLTRSNGKWLEAFSQAGLEVVKEEVQHGLPDELFTVKTWAVR